MFDFVFHEEKVRGRIEDRENVEARSTQLFLTFGLSCGKWDLSSLFNILLGDGDQLGIVTRTFKMSVNFVWFTFAFITDYLK